MFSMQQLWRSLPCQHRLQQYRHPSVITRNAHRSHVGRSMNESATNEANPAAGLLENVGAAIRKRPVALHVGYVGSGYRGLQATSTGDLEQRLQSVEGVLERAIFRAGLMHPSNYGHQHKVKWKRASRTDKGVHSLCSVISLNVLLDESVMDRDPEGVHYASLINQHLPGDVRVFSVQRINPRFDPRRFCQERCYTYYLPAAVLGIKTGSCPGDAEKLLLFRKALDAYKGTKPFHNYAGKRRQYRKPEKGSPTDPNAGRAKSSRERTAEAALAAQDGIALTEDDVSDEEDDIEHPESRTPPQTSTATSNNAAKPDARTGSLTLSDGSLAGSERNKESEPAGNSAKVTESKDDANPSVAEVHASTWKSWVGPVAVGLVAWMLGGTLETVTDVTAKTAELALCGLKALGLGAVSFGLVGLIGAVLGFRRGPVSVLRGVLRWGAGMFGWKPKGIDEAAAGNVQSRMKDRWNQTIRYNETVDESDRVVRSHFRTIREISCSDVMSLTPGGVPCLKIQLVGSSFMLHQIRHMIGAAVGVVRGVVPWELFQLSLTVPMRASVPRAPPQTLMLEGATFGNFYREGAVVNQQLLANSGDNLQLREQGQLTQQAFSLQVLHPSLDALLQHPIWSSWTADLHRYYYCAQEIQRCIQKHKIWSSKPRLADSAADGPHATPTSHADSAAPGSHATSMSHAESSVADGPHATPHVTHTSHAWHADSAAAGPESASLGSAAPLLQPESASIPEPESASIRSVSASESPELGAAALDSAGVRSEPGKNGLETPNAWRHRPPPLEREFEPEVGAKAKAKAKKRRLAADVDLFCRVNMVVGRVEGVYEVAGSHKLYVCTLECGRAGQRQAVAALKPHMKMEQLKGQVVVAVTNLRSAKLAGCVSNGVVLVACQEREGEPKTVTLLQPPGTCALGDSIFLAGQENCCRTTPPAHRINPPAWERFQNMLGVQESGVVTFAGSALVSCDNQPIVVGHFVNSDVQTVSDSNSSDGDPKPVEHWVVEGA